MQMMEIRAEVPIVLETPVPIAEDVKNRALEASKDIEYLVGPFAADIARHDHRVVIVDLPSPKLADGVDVVVDIGTS